MIAKKGDEVAGDWTQLEGCARLEEDG